MKVISCSYEKYTPFYVSRNLVFLDSFQFMSSSLDKLSNNLSKDEFVYTDMAFKKKASLVRKKVFTHTITWIVLISFKKEISQ